MRNRSTSYPGPGRCALPSGKVRLLGQWTVNSALRHFEDDPAARSMLKEAESRNLTVAPRYARPQEAFPSERVRHDTFKPLTAGPLHTLISAVSGAAPAGSTRRSGSISTFPEHAAQALRTNGVELEESAVILNT